MAEIISVYQNDLLPELEVDVVDYDPLTGVETVVDLSAVGTVLYFKARPVDGGAIKIDGQLTAVDAPNGKFKYEWLVGDTDTVGEFLAEVSIEYPSTKVRTVLQFELHVLEEII